NAPPARCHIGSPPGAPAGRPARRNGLARCRRKVLALGVLDLYKPRYLTRGPWLLAVRWLRPEGVPPRDKELTGPRRINRRSTNVAARLFYAPALGSRRSLRPSGPPLESED